MERVGRRREGSARSRLFIVGVALTAALCGGCDAAKALAKAASARLTLSTTSLAFAATTVGNSSATQGLTLTNSGKGTMTLSGISLSDTSDYSMENGCPGTLAASASCTLTLAFTPKSAATLAASVTITDNASGSPQKVKLSGVGIAASGPPPAVTRTLYAFPEADKGVTPLYALVNGAQKTIDMTMYELVDTTFSGDLVAACGRGVKVRVILDQNLEKASNTAAYNQLNAAANCSAVWANPSYAATHQKTITVDGTQSAILSLNLTSRYYSLTRDFGLVENDPADVAAIEATFNQDYVSATYSPGNGDDLIWSPTTAQVDLLGIINGATKTLLVENEEMAAGNIVSALEAASKRGVAVEIAMTDNPSYATEFTALKAAGCGMHVYPNTSTALYIHAKALLADFGLSTQKIYMGSINFSTASMTKNRELGLYITDSASAQLLNAAIASDYAGAPSF